MRVQASFLRFEVLGDLFCGVVSVVDFGIEAAKYTSAGKYLCNVR